MKAECIKEINDYLKGMGASGFVPVPETLREIAARHGETIDELEIARLTTYQSGKG